MSQVLIWLGNVFHVEQGILINCTRKYERSTRRDVLLGATFYSSRRSTRREVLLGAMFYSGRRSTRGDVQLGATFYSARRSTRGDGRVTSCSIVYGGL